MTPYADVEAGSHAGSVWERSQASSACRPFAQGVLGAPPHPAASSFDALAKIWERSQASRNISTHKGEGT